MNTYTLNFIGNYRMPASLIVVAESKEIALKLAMQELKKIGLHEDNNDLSINDLEEIDTSIEQVKVLTDGEY